MNGFDSFPLQLSDIDPRDRPRGYEPAVLDHPARILRGLGNQGMDGVFKVETKAVSTPMETSPDEQDRAEQ